MIFSRKDVTRGSKICKQHRLHANIHYGLAKLSDLKNYEEKFGFLYDIKALKENSRGELLLRCSHLKKNAHCTS